jgi:hypothetical protein
MLPSPPVYLRKHRRDIATIHEGDLEKAWFLYHQAEESQKGRKRIVVAITTALTITVAACGVKPFWLVALEGIGIAIMGCTSAHLLEVEQRKLRTQNYKMWLRALKSRGKKLRE